MKIIKSSKENIPSLHEENTIYIGTVTEENDYSEIIVEGKTWASTEYVDEKIGDIERILDQL